MELLENTGSVPSGEAPAASGPPGQGFGDAVDAFLLEAPPPAGYVCATLAGYRALCRRLPEPEPAATKTPGALEPVLLAGGDGALYLAQGMESFAEETLRGRRLRPTGSTLALRLPPEMGGGPATFTLWASPKYLAQRGGVEDGLWK